MGSFLQGMLITFLAAICLPVMGVLNFANSTFSDADFSIFEIIIGNIAQYIQSGGLVVICIMLFVAPIVIRAILPNKDKNKY